MIARLILTTKCNRACPGCCNDSLMFSTLPSVKRVEELKSYEGLIITGGEPMLYPEQVHEIARQLRLDGWDKPIYLQTALGSAALINAYKRIIPLIDGITFTLHLEHTIEDLQAYSIIGSALPDMKPSLSVRINVDERLPLHKFDWINVHESTDIRMMPWKEECPIPQNEVLLMWKGEL